LLVRAIELLTSDCGELIYASAKLLTNFSISPDPLHIAFLFDQSILDRIFDSYHKPATRDHIHHMLLSLLANLTADDPHFQQLVLAHPVMSQVVLREAVDSGNPVHVGLCSK
jgi:hypothetical protein